MKYSKYGNAKVVYDGITFDSKAERLRYVELKLLERAGKITQLYLQPEFELLAKQKGERAVTYYADFTYHELSSNQIIVEDVKSPATAKDKAYIIKRKLFKAKYGGTHIFKEIIY